MDFTNTISGSRVWVVNKKEISDIFFYQDGEILAKVGSSFLEFEKKFAPEKSGVNTDIKSIPEITSVENARHLDLDRKDCFVFKSVFYIYAPIVAATKPSPAVFNVYEGGNKKYLNYFNITITVDGEKRTLLCHERFFLDIDGRPDDWLFAENLLSLLGVSRLDVDIPKVIKKLALNKEEIKSLLS